MSCQIDGGGDGEVAQFQKHVVRRARKKYTCGECQEPILPGAHYEESRMLCEGSWDTFRTCELCAEIREKLFCSWVYGMIWEEIRQENVFSISLTDLSIEAIEKIGRFWNHGKKEQVNVEGYV